jgi:hypothetical protein
MILARANEVTERFSAALTYAQLGWQVFPVHSFEDGMCTCGKVDCGNAAKHPITTRGFLDASAEQAQIERWSQEDPRANIGIRTGPESGIWVLDVDGPEGIDALARLEQENCPLPRTPTARTGGGGKHLLFAYPSQHEVRSRTRIGRSIDTRGIGGYVVAPPSLHASGKTYDWEISPDDVAPADAPMWLLDWIARGSTGNGVGKLRVVCDDLESSPGAVQGTRHSDACRLVGIALGRGENPTQVGERALRWAARCTPPLSENDIRRIVQDLAAKQAASDAPESSWEPLNPFDVPELPPFPTDSLPDWQREFVEAEAEATQTPEDLAGMLVIATNAAACAKKAVVRVNKGYCEPLNLYVVTALGVANRKSTVFHDATAPISAYEREEVCRSRPQLAQQKAGRAIKEAQLEKLQSEAAKAKSDKVESLTKQVTALAEELDSIVLPRLPRLLASDVTPEKVASLLSEYARMAVFSPEADVFDLMSGRYARSPNFTVYLKGHSGDDLRVDRINRPPEFVRNPALTLATTVQPEVLRGLTDKKDFRDRGLLARFLYSLPTSLVGHRRPDPLPVPQEIRDEYGNRMRDLLGLEVAHDELGEIVSHELFLSREAEALRVQLATWIEPKLGPGGELEHMADWGGKLAGAVVRIAGNLHMADHAGQAEPWNILISGSTMSRAIRIGTYLIAHAQAAFRSMGANPTVTEAQYILEWIRRAGRDSFSLRELFEGTKGRLKRVNDLTAPLDLLVEYKYIRRENAPALTGPGRPPSPIFQVNPAVHEHCSAASLPVLEVPFALETALTTGHFSDGIESLATTGPADEWEYEEGLL